MGGNNMKTLLINGSPRTHGNSMRIAEYLNSVYCIDSFSLTSMKNDFCTGCLYCEDKGICPLQDDISKVIQQVKSAENIILVFPVYFDNVPAGLKNFLDRLNLIVKELHGKKVGIAVVGQANQESWDNAIAYVRNYCDIVGMELVGSVAFFARKHDELYVDGMVAEKLLALMTELQVEKRP